ncbi:MAG: hypothetical protein M3N51_02210 [Actinomycetota bacterium]|nr:hypothetical protein [Actinomycetota bacterium]
MTADVRIGEQAGRKPGPLPLLLVVATVVAAGVAFAAVRPPSGLTPTTTTLPEESPPVPARFEDWPSLVMIWEVRGPVQEVDPCRTAGRNCFVRLAWEAGPRWSLALSDTPFFTEGDPLLVEWQGVRYYVQDGVVTSRREGEGLPAPVTACQRLLESYHGGAEGEVTRHNEQWTSGRRLLTMTSDGETVQCLQPWGIPLYYAGSGRVWQQAPLDFGETVQFRPPRESELGTGLVQGHAVVDPAPCRSGGALAFSASPPGQWLTELAGQGDYHAVPAGSGIGISARVLTHERPVFAWATADDRRLLLPGMRTAQLGQGVLVEEALEPSIVSFAAGGLRIWLAVPDHLAGSRSTQERINDELHEVALALFRQAHRSPYVGAPPAGPGTLLLERYQQYPRLAVDRLPPELDARRSGPGFASQTDRWRIQAVPLTFLPDRQFYHPSPPLDDGSPVWSPNLGKGELTVLAGGAVLSAKASSEETTEEELRQAVAPFARAANRCPWLGLPAQPAG